VRSEVLIAPKFEARCAALTRSGSLTGSMWPSSRGPLLSFYVVRRGIPFRSRCPTRLALLRITQIQNVCRLTFWVDGAYSRQERTYGGRSSETTQRCAAL